MKEISMIFDHCPLIGYKFKTGDVKPVTGPTIEYETEFVGKVKITLVAYQELIADQGKFQKYVIAGICKNRTLQNQEPILIDSNFIREGYKKLNPPIEFEEKCNHFLKYLYQNGGKENKDFELNSTMVFPIAYSDREEFCRIVDQLKNDYFIAIRKTHQLSGDRHPKLFMGVKLTKLGKEEAVKSLPKMPLFGLVNQQITTGDFEVDQKINHGRELFFSEPGSFDNMRSACETLIFVLEPLRKDLKNYFSDDAEDFFKIVNNFDIRHNKNSTKNIVYEEQLEWVFYSLLNTINTYVKLKQRTKK